MKTGLFGVISAAFMLLCASMPVRADKHVRIGFYGDSTAYGSTLKNGAYVQSPNNEPYQLQQMLQQRYGDQFYSTAFVENHGVPGAICSDFLWGQNKVTNSWRQEMATSPVDIVIMNTGINDAGVMATDGFIWCYEQLAGIASQNGKIFVIESPNPVNFAWNSNIWGIVHDETYVTGFLNLLLIDQWTNIMNNTPNWQGLLSDGVHPSDSLYATKAAFTYQTIAPLVDQVRSTKK